MYDLTIGIETLSYWKAILNFHDKTVIIYYVELPMHSLLCNPRMLKNLYREATAPAISLIATNQVTQLFDAKYEKVKLPKVVEDNCRHLNLQQSNDFV